MTTDVDVNKTEEQKTERTRTGYVCRPNVNILEGSDELLLMADIPGAKNDAIEINFEDGVLTIEAKVEPRHREPANLVHCEYGVGDFRRTLHVNEEVDANRIHAEYANGVLSVHLPKVVKAKPRKIAVKAAG